MFTEVGNNNGVIVDGGVDAHTHASIYEVQLLANTKMGARNQALKIRYNCEQTLKWT